MSRWAQLQLHPAVLEVDGQGDQGHAVLHDPGLELADLLFVHQQPPDPVRVAVEDVALFVGADVHAPDEELAVLDDAEGILEIQRSSADALDLGARQLDARLVAFQHEIVVERFAVRCDGFDPLSLRHGARSSSLLCLPYYTTDFQEKKV